jgi:hypothetical protein
MPKNRVNTARYSFHPPYRERTTRKLSTVVWAKLTRKTAGREVALSVLVPIPDTKEATAWEKTRPSVSNSNLSTHERKYDFFIASPLNSVAQFQVLWLKDFYLCFGFCGVQVMEFLNFHFSGVRNSVK